MSQCIFYMAFIIGSTKDKGAHPDHLDRVLLQERLGRQERAARTGRTNGPHDKSGAYDKSGAHERIGSFSSRASAAEHPVKRVARVQREPF